MCSVFVCVRCAVLYTNDARQHRNGYTHTHYKQTMGNDKQTLTRTHEYMHKRTPCHTRTYTIQSNLMEMSWQRQLRHDTARKCVYRVYCVCTIYVCVSVCLFEWRCARNENRCVCERVCCVSYSDNCLRCLVHLTLSLSPFLFLLLYTLAFARISNGSCSTLFVFYLSPFFRCLLMCTKIQSFVLPNRRKI